MSKLINITDESFDTDVIQSGKPVLVDFWGPACGPCLMMAPTLDELAAEYAEHLTIAKLNVDDNPVTLMRFGVMGLPTLLLFRNGEVIERVPGFVRKDKLVSILSRHLA
jgi:thioredoxin 1